MKIRKTNGAGTVDVLEGPDADPATVAAVEDIAATATLMIRLEEAEDIVAALYKALDKAYLPPELTETMRRARVIADRRNTGHRR